MTAQQIADMTNKAEAEMLASVSADMRAWYLALPREIRVELACNAYKSATA